MAATPTASATTPLGGALLTPSPTLQERPGLGGGTPGSSPFITILIGTLLALAVLALLGLFAFLGARRRRRPDTRLELLPEEARQAPVAPPAEEAQPAKQPTSWERDWALDEAPIGSVEYRPPPEPLPEEEGGA